VPLERVRVELGDTTLPAAGLSGGSSTTTSLMSALALGCEQLRERLAREATAPDRPLAGRDPAGLRLVGGRLTAPGGSALPLAEAVALIDADGVEALAEFVPPGSAPDALGRPAQGSYRGSPQGEMR
jgi:xanthine dehydrogenase YagR molybdenum-binding subunit